MRKFNGQVIDEVTDLPGPAIGDTNIFRAACDVRLAKSGVTLVEYGAYHYGQGPNRRRAAAARLRRNGNENGSTLGQHHRITPVKQKSW